MVSSMVSQGSGRSTATLLNLAVVAAGIAVVCNAGRKRKASSTRMVHEQPGTGRWGVRAGRKADEGLTPGQPSPSTGRAERLYRRCAGHGSKDGRKRLSQEQSRTGEEKAVDVLRQGRAGQHRTDRDRDITYLRSGDWGEACRVSRMWSSRARCGALALYAEAKRLSWDSPGVFTIAPGPRRRALVTGPARPLPGTGMLPRLVTVSSHGGEVSDRPLVAVAIGISLHLHASRARFCVHHVGRGVKE